MELGARLSTIAAQVQRDLVVADIGTDHAYLPIYLINTGVVSRAIATDVKKGPLAAAQNSVQTAGLAAKIELRLGNGLEPLKVGEAQTIILAGMGGGTIQSILAADLPLAQSAEFLVLQPMGEAAGLRRFLYQNGWQITEEELVKEGDHLYQILVAKPGKISSKAEFDTFKLEVGLILLQKRPLNFLEHLQNIFAKYNHICLNMEKSFEAKNSIKYRQAKVILEQAKEFLQCLSN